MATAERGSELKRTPYRSRYERLVAAARALEPTGPIEVVARDVGQMLPWPGEIPQAVAGAAAIGGAGVRAVYDPEFRLRMIGEAARAAAGTTPGQVAGAAGRFALEHPVQTVEMLSPLGLAAVPWWRRTGQVTRWLTRSVPPRKPLPIRATGREVEQVFKAEKLAFTPEDQQNLADVLQGLGMETRPTMTFQDMIRSAQAGFKGHPEEVVRTASQIRQHREAWKAARTLAQDPASSTRQVQLANAAMDDSERSIELLLAQRVKSGTEFGRAVAAYRILAQDAMDPVHWYTQAKRTLGDRPFTPEIRNTVDTLIAQRNTLGLATFVAGLRKQSLTDFFVKLRNAAMLSNPLTHVVNVLSNVSMRVLEDLKDVPAWAIDAMIPGARVKALSPRLLEAEIGALGPGLRAAGEELRYGASQGAYRKFDIGRAGATQPFTGRGKSLGEALDALANVALRPLGAEDMLARVPAFKRSLAEQAILDVRRQGLSGRAFDQAYQELVANPTREMIEIARQAADYATFQQAHPLARAINQFAAAGPAQQVGANLAIPFRHTPFNLFEALLDYSPLGFARAPYAASRLEGPAARRALVEGLGRATIGTAGAATGALLAARGLMTGESPEQANERALRALEGIQRDAVTAGGRSIQISRLSPTAQIGLLGATTQERLRGGEGPLETAAELAAVQARGILEQPMMSSAADLIDALRHPEGAPMGQVAGSMVGSLIPAIVAAQARGWDPYQRRTETVGERIAARVPGLAGRLEPRISALGEPVRQVRGPVGQMFNPFPSQVMDTSLAVRALSAAGWAPATQRQVKINLGQGQSVRLTGQRRTEFETERGRGRRDLLTDLVIGPAFWGLPPEEKKRIVKRAVADADRRVEARWRAMLEQEREAK